MGVDIIAVHAFDLKTNGLLKIDLNVLPIPQDFMIYSSFFLTIPPLQYGGNHKHAHRELFISLDDHLELHWLDGEGKAFSHKMKEGNCIYLFNVHPFTPHALVNMSKMHSAAFLEFQDSEQKEIEHCIVYELNCL
jgi:uncharacterized RmlC-like cupin family protein